MVVGPALALYPVVEAGLIGLIDAVEEQVLARNVPLICPRAIVRRAEEAFGVVALERVERPKGPALGRSAIARLVERDGPPIKARLRLGWAETDEHPPLEQRPRLAAQLGRTPLAARTPPSSASRSNASSSAAVSSHEQIGITERSVGSRAEASRAIDAWVDE